eukprot:5786264-Karenia_brevis.AAC.1
MASCGVKVHHGIVGAKAALYIPPGHILCEKALSLIYSVRMSVFPGSSRILDNFEFIIRTINTFQGGPKTQLHPQYKGMLATRDGL